MSICCAAMHSLRCTCALWPLVCHDVNSDDFFHRGELNSALTSAIPRSDTHSSEAVECFIPDVTNIRVVIAAIRSSRPHRKNLYSGEVYYPAQLLGPQSSNNNSRPASVLMLVVSLLFPLSRLQGPACPSACPDPRSRWRRESRLAASAGEAGPGRGSSPV